MLVLTRKKGQSFKIGKDEDIEVKFLGKNQYGQFKIGIIADKNIPIVRTEIIGKR